MPWNGEMPPAVLDEIACSWMSDAFDVHDAVRDDLMPRFRTVGIEETRRIGASTVSMSPHEGGLCSNDVDVAIETLVAPEGIPSVLAPGAEPIYVDHLLARLVVYGYELSDIGSHSTGADINLRPTLDIDATAADIARHRMAIDSPESLVLARFTRRRNSSDLILNPVSDMRRGIVLRSLVLIANMRPEALV